MKKSILKKSLLPILICCFLLIFSLPLAAANSGHRHEPCYALSGDAQSYYSGEYAWGNLSGIDGIDTDNSLTAMSSPLYGDLRQLMTDTMTARVTYRNLTKHWVTTDDSADTEELLFYSDDLASKASGYIDREHVWAKSHASFYELNGGADLHHLRPEDRSINSTRSNYIFGDVVGEPENYKTKNFVGKTVLWYSSSDNRVEVKNDVKGDVARILLYVYVRWSQPNLCVDVPLAALPTFDSDDSKNDGVRVIEDLDTLLTWCENDPVDTWEMSRNDLSEDVQGNRNVFIDYPEYAWLLFDREIPEDMVTPSGEAVERGIGFFDVKKSAFYYEAVKWAMKNKVTAGTAPRFFSPTAVCTRAQMVTFLWRMLGSPEACADCSDFTDVPFDKYYYSAVNWAVADKITYGTSATTFSPDQKVTRGQVVTFLWRAANMPEPTSATTSFSDLKTDAYYRKAVLWAAENGITAGKTATTFCPDAPCSRGEIVTFLHRFSNI